jgi:hypothetical protein
MLALAALMVIIAFGLAWRIASNPDPPATTSAEPPGPAPVPAALATTTGEEGTLEIAVVSLDRIGTGMVELRLAVTHVGTTPTPLDVAQRFSADGPDRGTLAEVYLADLGHQRKLFILRDADGAPIGSRDEQPLAPNERRVLWARYPAPGVGDEALVVHVPHAEPMPNVPVGVAAGAVVEP